MADQELEIGVDEAGRGAVLGPLVMAACALDSSTASALREMGVADSKSFGAPAKAQARRASLSAAILERAQWCAIHVVPASEVDAAVVRGQLNALERTVAEALLATAPTWTRLVLDGARLFFPLASRLPHAEARNRAEKTSVSVAAASILAKAERDRLFAAIRFNHEARFGPIRGEGYPNRSTERFLEAFYEAEGDLPPETRRSWSWPPLARLCGTIGTSLPLDFGEV